MQKIAIYSRKSRFTGKGESIENQIELCRRYICAQYPQAEILIYEDEGFSGGNTERPQFKRMMADARKKKFIAIVCYRLDRISRNIGDFAGLIEELNGLAVSFISIKEQFDTASPMGRAMMYIASVFSQLERETIAERIRDNMHELAKTGRWLGGITPTGYVSAGIEHVTVEGKVKKACMLKTVPEEANLVRLIFQKFIETASLTKTETFLLQNRYTTKNKKPFTRFAIKNILENPVYMIADGEAHRYLKEMEADIFAATDAFDGSRGVMAYNRTIQKAGRANRVRPIGEWVISVGRHEGLISGAEWVKAQSLLTENRHKSFRRPRSNTALLSGLLYCGMCGAAMRPKLGKRQYAKEEQAYDYICTTREKSLGQCCDMKNINGNTLDVMVWAEITKLCEDRAEFTNRLEQGRRNLREESEDDNRAELRKAQNETESEINELVCALSKASGRPAQGYIMRQIDELHARREVFRQRLEEAEAADINTAFCEAEMETLCIKLAALPQTLDSLDTEQKRFILREIIIKTVLDGENLHVYLRGSGVDDGKWFAKTAPL